MDKYCVLPFVSIRIEDDLNKNSSKIKPCCIFLSNGKIFRNLQDYLESDTLAELQKNLQNNNELPPGCSTCRKVEDEGQLSVRQLKNKFFQNNRPTSTNIKELDVFISNTCNINCIMCSPKFSSAVGAEQKKLGFVDKIYNFDQTSVVLETLDSLSELTHITIAGGEFFYAKHHKALLEKIVEMKIPNVKITTNGTVFDSETIGLLEKIPSLEIRFSLDGTDKRYEFIRYPAQWNVVRTNISRYLESLPNAKFETVIVVQPLSIGSVFDWLNYANSLGLETHWINILGDNISWSMLTDQERQITSEFLLKNIKNHKLLSSQIVYLMNLARTTLSRTNFDIKVRQQSINHVVSLCRHRKIPEKDIDFVFGFWPELLEQIKKQLS